MDRFVGPVESSIELKFMVCDPFTGDHVIPLRQLQRLSRDDCRFLSARP